MQKRDKRNSLIELYRFFFALVVVKSHTLFPYDGPYIGPGGIAVEFFFIVSGYLFMRSLEKWKDLPLKESWPKMLVAKIKPIAIPLAIGLLSNLVYQGTVGDKSIWGYLWYVRAMLVAFTVYLVLSHFIKNSKAFFVITLIICIVCTVVRFGFGMYALSYTRAGSALSLGILLAYLPPLKLKNQNRVWWIVAPLQLICIAMVVWQWALWSIGGVHIAEACIVFLLYPALVYFTFQLPVHNRVFNYLGALSFGLYAFQCPADLLRGFGMQNLWLLFGFIVLASVLEDLGKRLYKRKSQAK